MSTPIDVSLHALNAKAVLALLFIGVLPLLLIFAITIYASEGRPSKVVAFAVISLSGLIAGLGLWQLAAVRLKVDSHSITVGGGLYRVSVPLERLAAGDEQVERVQNYTLGPRTNGIGMPGLSLGWFALRKGGKAFVAITDPNKVVRIPTRGGYTILVSVDDPDALVQQLSRD